MRMAARSFREIPTTRDPGVRFFSMSPTVNPLKFTGDAPYAPGGPPMFTTAGSSTTLTSFLRSESNHWLATMPECQPLRPDNNTE